MGWADNDQQRHLDWAAAVIAMADEPVDPTADQEEQPQPSAASDQVATVEKTVDKRKRRERHKEPASVDEHGDLPADEGSSGMAAVLDIVADSTPAPLRGLEPPIRSSSEPAFSDTTQSSVSLPALQGAMRDLINVVHDLASDILTVRREVAEYAASTHTNQHDLSRGMSAVWAEITAVSTKVHELSALGAEISGVATKVDQLSVVRDDIASKVDELSALRAEISGVAAQVDELIRNGLDTRFAETGTRLVGDLDTRLGSSLQRFEALSQAMMTLVGEPVDALTEKVNQLATVQRSTPDVQRSIGEISRTQVQLEEAICGLRQDGLDREALLRQALDKIDRLTGAE